MPVEAILKARSPSCGKGMIYDGSFSGCTRLQEIRLLHTVPCGVGTDLFAGTEGFRVCVPASALELFATHYNWGAYKDYLSGYEG